jgi:uncharacterized protein YcfL
MKPSLILVALVFLVALVACGSQKQISSSERDGTSVEKAVIAKSIDAEYQWVASRYPGSDVVAQSLMTKNRKPYDRLEVMLSNGQTIFVYFDISSFFGKW